MIAWPTAWTPTQSSALLILLIVGHVLADFLLQTRRDVETKKRGSGYGVHGLSVFLTHTVVLLPVISLDVAILVAVIAVVHVAIDWAKFNLVSSRWGQFKAFILDQVAHISVILLGWYILTILGEVSGFRWLSANGMATYLVGAILASAFVFNATGGSVIVRGILNLLPDEPEGEGGEKPAGYEDAGHLIGILERTLVLALVLYGQWAAIALLITAKSIARFEEIKVREFAEYYLVGTLSSLLVALAIGFVLEEVIFPLIT